MRRFTSRVRMMPTSGGTKHNAENIPAHGPMGRPSPNYFFRGVSCPRHCLRGVDAPIPPVGLSILYLEWMYYVRSVYFSG